MQDNLASGEAMLDKANGKAEDHLPPPLGVSDAWCLDDPSRPNSTEIRGDTCPDRYSRTKALSSINVPASKWAKGPPSDPKPSCSEFAL